MGTDAVALEQAATPTTDVQLPESLVSSNADLLQSSTTSVARDILRRRRHSSNLMQLTTDDVDIGTLDIGSYVVQERLARSVSPVAAVHQNHAEDSDEDKEDMIGLWSRVPRSITSDDDLDNGYNSEDESDSSDGDDMDEDDVEEEEEEDKINLFGHR